MARFWGLDDPAFEGLVQHERIKIFRERVYHRDQGICAICGKPVEKSGMSLDHIKPVSHGGQNHWNNLRLAHRGCNASRGNREPYDEIEETADEVEEVPPGRPGRKPTGKVRQTLITLPLDLKARAQTEAQRQKISLAELIREALEHELAGDEARLAGMGAIERLASAGYTLTKNEDTLTKNTES